MVRFQHGCGKAQVCVPCETRPRKRIKETFTGADERGPPRRHHRAAGLNIHHERRGTMQRVARRKIVRPLYPGV